MRKQQLCLITLRTDLKADRSACAFGIVFKPAQVAAGNLRYFFYTVLLLSIFITCNTYGGNHYAMRLGLKKPCCTRWHKTGTGVIT